MSEVHTNRPPVYSVVDQGWCKWTEVFYVNLTREADKALLGAAANVIENQAAWMDTRRRDWPIQDVQVEENNGSWLYLPHTSSQRSLHVGK